MKTSEVLTSALAILDKGWWVGELQRQVRTRTGHKTCHCSLGAIAVAEDPERNVNMVMTDALASVEATQLLAQAIIALHPKRKPVPEYKDWEVDVVWRFNDSHRQTDDENFAVTTVPEPIRLVFTEAIRLATIKETTA